MKTFLSTLIVLGITLLAGAAQANEPRVHFDVPQAVAVRDVTSPEFALAHPAERLIEARIPISMLLDQGRARDVHELVHRLESTTAGAQVMDYSPKTMLATTVIGSTHIERQTTRDAKATLDVGGSYAGLVTGKAHGELTHHAREDSKFEQLPSLELLTASGTVDRGRGVYFKLKASPRTTLEGSYDYLIVLRVPRVWRAGLLYVTSEARGLRRSPLPGGDAIETVGSGRFLVALYQQGDADAHRAAQNYALAEQALRRAAHDHRALLERRTYPTIVHKLGITRDDALARDWLERAIFRGQADTATVEKLPADVRLAVETLLSARRSLLSLHEHPLAMAAGN